MNTSASPQFGVLFCTHKRGAGMALFRLGGDELTEDLLDAENKFIDLLRSEPVVESLPRTGAKISTLRAHDCSFAAAICEGLTAENLAGLYLRGLSALGTCDERVRVLGVVWGPGSFTGLRLGCSFANGLNLGKTRQLWAVEGLHPNAVRSRCSSRLQDVPPAFWGEQSQDADDPYAVRTSFSDVFAHLRNWSSGAAHEVAVVEPCYGREPTPVLKLKQQQGDLSS